MIQVENLVKRYAGAEAVRGISFEVKPGEIVGFLGPNGAGKSSTMRILSGFMPATSGDVRIAGHDVFAESIEVRRKIGYMPENVPLYPDMRVDEFLKFRARLKGVRGARVKERVEEVKRQCNLVEVQGKIIGTLSKGYRQRVGLADALVHDPELLILDEPTIGLDPNQIRQVRELIKSLGGRHTVLLSTHILPEVEMTCSRVIILNKGRIEDDGAPEALTRRLLAGSAVVIEVKASAELVRSTLGGIPDLDEIETEETEGWCRAHIYAVKGTDLREAVAAAVLRAGWPLRELVRQKATLEDVFVELTHEDKI
jgi:ABC-2 type transport system ATP-binding protein